MATARKFPDCQRMPRVDQNALSRHSKRREQLHQKPNRNEFEADDGEFHPSHGFAYTRREEIRGLRSGRVHSVRVITAIDLWVYLFITQTLQMLIGRNVTIGIDACCLNAPVPHISINVIRKIRWSKNNAETEDAGQSQNDK